jgi:hypothetical protein
MPAMPSPTVAEGGSAKTGPVERRLSLDEMELAPYLLERGQCLVEICAGVGRRYLAADSSLALGYDGVAEAGDEHSFAQKQIAHPNRCRRFSKDHRNDRRFPSQWFEAQPKQLFAKVARVCLKSRNSLRVRLEEFDAGQRARCHCRRQRVAEELRTRPLGQVVTNLGRCRNKASGSASERLAERRCDDVHLPDQSEVLRRAAPALPQNAGCMRVIHHEYGLVPAAQLDQIRQLGDRSFHGEDPIGHDHLDAPVSCRGELRIEIGKVAVLVYTRLALGDGLGQADTIDNRGVIELIADDQIMLGEQSPGHSLIGIPCTHEAECRRGAHKPSTRGFECAMDRECTADEAN